MQFTGREIRFIAHDEVSGVASETLEFWRKSIDAAFATDGIMTLGVDPALYAHDLSGVTVRHITGSTISVSDAYTLRPDHGHVIEYFEPIKLPADLKPRNRHERRKFLSKRYKGETRGKGKS